MIKAGLALIAYCLPTLKPLISEQGIQSAINSARSAISLHTLSNHSARSNYSNGTGNSRSAKKTNSYGKIEDGRLNQAPLRTDTMMGMDTNATHDDNDKPAMLPGQITVKRDVEVSETSVQDVSRSRIRVIALCNCNAI
jgi:hypothetical protein